jgi:ABC-type transport system substrate-binding protein
VTFHQEEKKMLAKRISVFVAVLAVASLVLSACKTETVKETVVVIEKETVVETVVVIEKETVVETVMETVVETVVETREVVVTATPGPAPAAGPVRGGVLKHAVEAPGNLDPAFFSSIGDDEIGRQWHDFLVYVDEDSQPDPERSVAASWEANQDGTVWTFEIRQGIKFHDGKDLTADDIVFTFNRLRDPQVGAAITPFASPWRTLTPTFCLTWATIMHSLWIARQRIS